MKNTPLLIGTILATVVLAVVVALTFSNSTDQNGQPADGGHGAPTGPQAQVSPDTLIADARHSKGAPVDQAVVTIVEFSDFQCPFCRDAYQALNQLVNDNPDQVRLVYRHFPLRTIHPFAQLAAQASEAAAQQGKFWQYHDALFEQQDDWSRLGSLGDAREFFADLAVELEIDKDDFLERIDSDQVTEAITTDLDLVNQLGVNSTPTLYVNGQRTALQQLPDVVASQAR
ncbi:MAG: hypothetical protein COU69_03855 [Candidatus Pacebacteria bacterium CG10_big_fil_rev_8_21_14_0_10_56_10]|nr:MAG: hypothetical protein COU69_03855 [Candidatus Pacebacteria bacterium CG10_big_fil_rev_8_21_14_0_10_56_10]